MRLLFFSLSLVLAVSYVHSKDILMTEFTGSFNNPAGQGQVKQFSVAQGPVLGDANISIELEEATLHITVVDDEVVEEFSWEDLSSSLTELNQAQWSNLNLNHNSSSLQASAQSLQTQSKDSELNLSMLNLQCDLGLRPDDIEPLDHILSGCLNRQAKLNLRLVDIINHSGASLVSSLMQSLHLGMENIQATNRFENIEVDIRDNNFTAAVTTKVVINATIRLSGKTFYDQGQDRVRIRIDRARAGFINVTNMLFDELEKVSSDRVQVNRPWITIDLAE